MWVYKSNKKRTMSMRIDAPSLLANKSMLQLNKPKKVSLYGCDYVFWKDTKGEINALSNACPHMDAILSEGWCKQRKDNSSFSCLSVSPVGV